MTTAPPLPNPIFSWPCLQANPIPPPKSNPQPKIIQSKQQKTFGDDRVIQIPDDENGAGLEACKHNFHGRIIWPKGSNPITVKNLRTKLLGFCKDIKGWGVTSIGKGFYVFSFSGIEDIRRMRSIGSWNLSPGLLKIFAWSKDFIVKNGICKKRCFKMLPEITDVVDSIEVDNITEPISDMLDVCEDWERLKRNHKVDVVLASHLARYVKNGITKSIEETYSFNHELGDVRESINYKLCSNICLITKIRVQPYQGEKYLAKDVGTMRSWFLNFDPANKI
ncbi:DUF4283 domain protein [Medicago truncatula]|uniref:DUF4283 domain protein n=1 Tax=Medicago truncatula TaxID=3880 RepID=G7KIE2_MEDTR|nr:DUF4283 domain protein [Medicago truncatula]